MSYAAPAVIHFQHVEHPHYHQLRIRVRDECLLHLLHRRRNHFGRMEAALAGTPSFGLLLHYGSDTRSSQYVAGS